MADGGYFDNTGLSTAVEILPMVNSVPDAMRADSSPGGLLTLRKVEPVIIFMRNGDTRKKAVDIVSPMYASKSPALAFLNAWGRGSVAVSRDVAHLAERLRTKSHFVTYDLKRDSVRIPLRWLLSETASRELHQQTKNITFKHPKSK